MFEFFEIYWKFIVALVSMVTLLITVIKLFSNSYAIKKISQNEIKHIQADIKELKTEEKEFKEKLTKELHTIQLTCGRMERKISARNTKEDERHKAINRDIERIDRVLMNLKK